MADFEQNKNEKNLWQGFGNGVILINAAWCLHCWRWNTEEISTLKTSSCIRVCQKDDAEQNLF